MDKKTVLLCSHHDEKKAPMISTFAFIGAEYWCPYCGNTQGIFGDFKEVEWTKELQKEVDYWNGKAREFLSAKATFSCASLMWEGNRIRPDQLPAEELERRQKIVNEWKYESA